MGLCKLASYYNIDKGNRFKTNELGHNYITTYCRYLEEFKNTNFTLLEIGVREGKSLKMWQDYFINSRVFGIDIEPTYKCGENYRIKIFTLDAGNKENLKTIMDTEIKDHPFVIIDDGSHKHSDIISTFEVLKDYMPIGGFYFIEDIDPNSGKDKVKAYLDSYCSNNDLNIKVIEYVESHKRTGEELAVIQRK